MNKWQRINYLPCVPLGEDGKRITGSDAHIQLAREAAAQGMVLVKNANHTLPLQKGAKVALLGKGTIDYVKGGGGSGDVHCAYVHNLADGFAAKEAEGKVQIFSELVDLYRDYVSAQFGSGYTPGMMKEATIPADILERAAAFADVAVVSISRFSGEGWDRSVDAQDDIRTEYTLWPGEQDQRDRYKSVYQPNDFYLTAEERNLLEVAKANFPTVIVVLNVGGVIDTNWTFDEKIGAVLMSWQGGMEGGMATADVLCGDVNPSGHLTDTFAKELSDYPSTEGFHESADYVVYTDDIYVGYRYFETLPNAAKKVNYPFGYGLTYTNFDIEVLGGTCGQDDEVSFDVKVTNVGETAGREVVQLYYGAPQGLLKKPAKELGAFGKTATLQPGESAQMTLSCKLTDMKSFDDTGKIKDASFVLEKGCYHFYIGNNVRDAKETALVYELAEDVVLETVGHKVSPNQDIHRILSDGSRELVKGTVPQAEVCGLTRQDPYSLEGWQPDTCAMEKQSLIRPKEKPQLIDVAEGRLTLDAFVDALELEDRIHLLGGQPNTGVAVTNGMGNNRAYGIPNAMTSDGPAGVRTAWESGVKTTAWPVATNLACTWDMDLLEHVGREIAKEVKETNFALWLAPGCNIHRSPLCGRNFEYFSEDPYVSGKAAIAIIRGVQSQGIGATPKHFAANNKETNRKASNSVVSERALREIYLKQFEMIVKESDPYMIMSSYNRVNGIQASENTELLTGILRDEWGFDGPVTSDWWTLGEQYLEIKAGNDIKMSCSYPDRVMEAYQKGLISEEEIRLAVKRVLTMILRLE